MVSIRLNDQTLCLDAPISITDLLRNHGYHDKLVAVAVNGAFVPKSQHDTAMVHDQDAVEIVAPMQGG